MTNRAPVRSFALSHTLSLASPLTRLALPTLLALLGHGAMAQNVLTSHNDIARTGQYLTETTLTPANVNPAQFGKLFSQKIPGPVSAQPLYVAKVPIANLGTHNVVYVATTNDYVYAYDADINTGTAATALWSISLLTNSTPAGTLVSNGGVLGTPVIDSGSNTMYLVSAETQGTSYITRLHALDITSGAERSGSPVNIQASVAGTGDGSQGGSLAFDPLYQQQRPGLLLLNGVLYLPFGSIGDNGPWHGWVFSYDAASLRQIDVFCTSANGSGGGIWSSGMGLAAEVADPAKPYGRMFLVTGNGTFSATAPYTKTMGYGMSLMDVDLTGGSMTVKDEFTPFNEAALNSQDADLGSGAPVLLPTQTTASGQTLNSLVEVAKTGMIYILDRNQLGGFKNNSDQVVQEVQTPTTPGTNWGAGVWGSGAYWNNNIYFGGTNPAVSGSSGAASGNSLTAYSFQNGAISTTPTSQSAEKFIFGGPTPSVSANGATNGIVWILKTDALGSLGPAALLAYDATNLAKTLYSSNVNISKDSPGTVAIFSVPTIANGKVYVAANGQINVYGLLGVTPTAPAPSITPASTGFTGSMTVTITDAIAGATIYYTVNGSVPTTSSPAYKKPFTISSSETITAVAGPTGYLLSPPASATYLLTTTAAAPVFSLAQGTYTGTQTLTLSDTSPGAVIHYTLDGSTPTAASAVYTAPLSIIVSETVSAIAIPTAAGLNASPVANADYTIWPPYAINFSQGFAQANGPMQFNGSTDLDDFRLQLTNGGKSEAGSAFYATPVNVQQFTTDFTFQQSNPAGDGMAFVIQGVGPTALGGQGSGLGYYKMLHSLAIKFDIYDNGGEGPNSTGLYINGNLPTVPAINLTGTGIDLHNGNYKNVHITYDGVTLSMTITDAETLASYSNSWPISIPAQVGGTTAWVGFTGGTGGNSSSQKLNSWTYLPGPPGPNYPAAFDTVGLSLNGGAALSGTKLRLTDGQKVEARSAFFSTPVDIAAFTTSFQFQITNPNADGFTFAIQEAGPTALGGTGGGLGYGADPSVTATSHIAGSIAVKFDLCSNQGEGPDSTGLYLNGATPTTPSINLSSTGINLHSGHIFTAQLTYDGATLAVVTTDTVTHASATQSYSVNIPSIVGGNTAYVGFTGGSGGLTATQDILNWIYTIQ